MLCFIFVYRQGAILQGQLRGEPKGSTDKVNKEKGKRTRKSKKICGDSSERTEGTRGPGQLSDGSRWAWESDSWLAGKLQVTGLPQLFTSPAMAPRGVYCLLEADVLTTGVQARISLAIKCNNFCCPWSEGSISYGHWTCSPFRATCMLWRKVCLMNHRLYLNNLCLDCYF